MKGTLAVSATMLLMLSGCGQADVASKPTGPPEAQAGTPPYDTRLPMAEFMGHVMQHAGDGIWKWQGLVLDETGEHSLYPKNDEEWEEAESGALTLVEATNLLLIPGRRVPEPGWDKTVVEVRKVALKAAEAAEKHDKAAFFAAGSALDDACDACHVRYDPNFQAPPT